MPNLKPIKEIITQKEIVKEIQVIEKPKEKVVI